MTAIRFVLTALDTGRPVAHAVIAPEARYCSVAWTGETRLERRYVSGSAWLAVDAETAEHLPPGPLPTTSAVVMALLDFSKRSGIAVQYLHAMPIEAAPGEVSRVLDGMITTAS